MAALAADSQPRAGRAPMVMIGDLAEADTSIATDGVVTLKAPRPGDSSLLVNGRDAEFHRWLGPGAEVPEPVACVWVGGQLKG